MCNRDCMDTELKLLLFSPCQGKLNIAIQDIQNMLGLITIVVFYGSPPHANIPAFKMFFCLL